MKKAPDKCRAKFESRRCYQTQVLFCCCVLNGDKWFLWCPFWEVSRRTGLRTARNRMRVSRKVRPIRQNNGWASSAPICAASPLHFSSCAPLWTIYLPRRLLLFSKALQRDVCKRWHVITLLPLPPGVGATWAAGRWCSRNQQTLENRSEKSHEGDLMGRMPAPQGERVPGSVTRRQGFSSYRIGSVQGLDDSV